MNYYYDKNLKRLEIFISAKKSVVCLFCDKLTEVDIKKAISEMLIKYRGLK